MWLKNYLYLKRKIRKNTEPENNSENTDTSFKRSCTAEQWEGTKCWTKYILSICKKETCCLYHHRENY